MTTQQDDASGNNQNDIVAWLNRFRIEGQTDSPPFALSGTTREGWDRIAARPTMPPVISLRRYKRLSEDDQDTYDEARMIALSRFIVAETPLVNYVRKSIRSLVRLNEAETGARRGLLLDGPSGSGKTTATVNGALNYYHAVRRLRPDDQPVVYISLPPAAGAKMVSEEFAHFLGYPVKPRMNRTTLTNNLADLMTRLRTRLVIIDEIHNMNLVRSLAIETSDQLKYFAEHLPATFVYVGIDVHEAGVLAGDRGAQIAGRFVYHRAEPFGYGTSEERYLWDQLVATFDEVLAKLLLRHPAHALNRHTKYLYDRTGGSIGSLTHLLRFAAIEAIVEGGERFGQRQMAAVDLDGIAERQRPRRPRTRRPPKPPHKPTNGADTPRPGDRDDGDRPPAP